MLKECRQEKLKDTFTLAFKQPPNLLKLLTRAEFSSINNKEDKNNGLFKCNDIRCQLCNKYIQECTHFVTSNNVKWDIREKIMCNSKNVLYFLKCSICNLTTYTGKTNNFRLRMNNHISECRTGNTCDRFDIHVFNCRKINNYHTEPYFKIYAFMTVKHENMLLSYEAYLHKKQYDTLN